MPPNWSDMLGNLRRVAWAEAVGLTRVHSRDCNHLAAIGAGRCRGAAVAAAVVAVEEVVAVGAGHEQERS